MRDGAKFRLGDLCSIIRGETPIKQAVPGGFPMVVTAEERTSHESFQCNCRAVIVPLVSSTGHGHASIKRIHYQEGKFALGSILCAVVPKDEKRLNPKFLHVYFSYFKDQLIVPLMKGTANVSLSVSKLADLMIIVPPMDVQMRVIDFSLNDALTKPLEDEIAHQQTILAKLKQAILQEAIQGKLTADWRISHPQVEPASRLLHRIQAEKARLIAAKKLRPEKPLPKVTQAEITFEIPHRWEWCRFGAVARAYEAGSSFKCEHREVTGNEWGVIKTSAVTSGTFLVRENKFFRSDTPTDTSARVQVGDLIFCRASGSKGLAGKCAIVRDCNRNLLLSDKTIRVPLMDSMNQEYIALHNDSAQSQAYFDGLSTGKSTSMNNVTRRDLFKKPIPLPPLAEQAAIVARVEALMKTCRALEAEIDSARTDAADLLQAVLKEAFAPVARTTF